MVHKLFEWSYCAEKFLVYSSFEFRQYKALNITIDINVIHLYMFTNRFTCVYKSYLSLYLFIYLFMFLDIDLEYISI